jgi:flagellar biosynthesis/type III secretory pathway chaperone
MQALLDTLEAQLVKEFRACTDLCNLIIEERGVLLNNDTSRLAVLIESKEALLDELARLDDARRSSMDALGLILGIHEPLQTVAQLMSGIEPAVAGKFHRLREGILAVMDQIGELTRGNSILAQAALQHNHALQAFLIDLCQPLQNYTHPGTAGMPAVKDLPIIVGHDHRM